MSNAQTFLDLFNQLEQHLDKISQSIDHLGFRRLVENLSKTNQVIDNFKLQLIEYNELRNAIVHKSTGEAIAEPHPEVIGEMQHIYQVLTNPPQAISIAATPVYTCTTQTSVLEVIKAMSTNFYTSIPVYHDQSLVGVFSDNSITKWLADDNEAGDLGQLLIGQLQNYFDQPDSKFNSYQFLPLATNVFTVRRAFTRFTQEKKRLGAIFLTSNGLNTEDIVGIITAWDLPKIKQR